MTDAQRDEVLLQLVDKLNENIEFTKSINDKLNEVNSSLGARIDGLEAKLNENIEFTKSINDKLNENIEFTKSINDKLNENIEFTKNINDKLNENIEFTKRISNSVAVIEEVHGSKLGALSDGYTANSEKLDEIRNNIKNIYSILDKHDNQIYLLKSN